MRKWLVPLLVIAGLLVAAVPAAADGDDGNPAPPTIVLSEDGTTGYSTDVEGWQVSAVYAEYCDSYSYYGESPWYSEFPPRNHFHWYTDWAAGEGPLSLLAGWFSYWDGEEWSDSQWIETTRECTTTPAFNPWADAYNLIKYRNTDPKRPPELKALFWIHVPPGFTAAWEPSVLANCNTGALVPTASEAVKNYKCTKEMADAGLIKNLGVVHVQVNTLTGAVRSDDPDWPTSAYNRNWFGK